MNWDDVQSFLWVARSGTLSGAARALAVEHTTVARRVQALEAALGVRLFDRLPRGWQMTQDARALLPLAEAVEQSAAALERRVALTHHSSVRVSAAPVFATHFLAPRLREFYERCPAIQLELSTAIASAQLLRGEADLALRIGSQEVAPGLVTRSLGTVGYGLYGSVEQAARAPEARHYIHFDESMRASAQKQWLDAVSQGARVVLRSNDLFVHYQAARAQQGVALLPHFLVQPQDGLVPVAAAGPAFERPIALLFHPSARRAPGIAQVMAYLTELIKGEAGALLQGSHAPSVTSAMGDKGKRPSAKTPPSGPARARGKRHPSGAGRRG